MIKWRDVRTPQELESFTEWFNELDVISRDQIILEMRDLLEQIPEIDTDLKIEDAAGTRRNAPTSREVRKKRFRRSRAG